jgi:outer membrane lipoprotein-sorting protein
MRSGLKVLLFCAIGFLPAQAAFAADDLKSVLAKLDAAAKQFHTTSADFVFDTEMTDPVPDTDIQKGVVYYQRDGQAFEMAAHIAQHNSRPASATYTFTKGVLRYRDGDQVHVYEAGKWESYLVLGFGAGGSELAERWDVKYIGPATVDGKAVQQLELVAKDPQVRKTISKVTIWLDTDRAVSLQQRFDEPSGYRICKYSNIKVNSSLPSKAFDLKASVKPSAKPGAQLAAR